MPIDQQIAPFHPFPKRLTDGRTYVPMMDRALGRLETLEPELNIWAQQANQLQVDINQVQLDTGNARAAAMGYAQEAATQAAAAAASRSSAESIAAAVQSAVGLPSMAGNARRSLTVNDAEDGVAWTGGQFLPAYTNHDAHGQIDIDIYQSSVVELTVTGDLTLNFTNAPTGGERAVVYMYTRDLGSHALTSNIDFSRVQLAGAFAISGAKKTSRKWQLSNQRGENIGGLRSAPDGSRFVVLLQKDANLRLLSYTCTNGFSDPAMHSERSLGSALGATYLNVSFDISPDGTHVIAYYGQRLNYWTLATPWDVSTMSAVRYITATQGQFEPYIYDVAFSPDGMRLYSIRGSTELRWWNLATAYDVSGVGRAPDGVTILDPHKDNGVSCSSLHLMPDHSGVLLGYNSSASDMEGIHRFEFLSHGDPVGAVKTEHSGVLRHYMENRSTHALAVAADGKSLLIGLSAKNIAYVYDISADNKLIINQFGSELIAGEA